MRSTIRTLQLAAALSLLAAPLAAAGTPLPVRIQHVLLLSIDGLHGEDLTRCIAAGTCPHLASLATHGVTYTDASTTRPSDSFPGMIAQVTGGTPRVTGVYYDDTFDRALYPPSSGCKGPLGSEVRLTGYLDRNGSRLDGGAPGGLDANSAAAIDPARLPEERIGGRCRPLWPHDYLLVNTVFGVLHARGLRTAWIDKHPSYDILNGPGGPAEGPGSNIDDFFAPEIDAAVTARNLMLIGPASVRLADPRISFQDTLATVWAYDGLRLRALLNEIDGLDHSGRHRVGTPALFGINLQAINVAEKHAWGGYLDPEADPSPALRSTIEFVDRSIGRIVAALRRRGLAGSTLVIVSAKSGNAPIDRTRVKIISDRTVLTPALDKLGSADRFHVADDIVLEWLMPAYRHHVRAVIRSLIAQQAAGVDLGIGKFYAGPELATVFGDPHTSPRAPDFVLSPRLGVIYSSHVHKVAEHGGVHEDDRDVALLVSNPALRRASFPGPVETAQIAPTIARMLGLDPRSLQAVRLEGTRALPDLRYPAHR